MIDTHAHITKDFYDDLDLVVKDNLSRIAIIINSATNVDDSFEVVQLAELYPEMYASVGIHPTESGNIKDLEKLLIHPKVIAIGEIGLDFYHKPIERAKQLALFASQMELAQKYNKPVIIHSREATREVIEVLRKYPNIKGIIHCFSGSLETARKYIAMGYKIGIGGVLTFKNSKLSGVVKELSLEDIVVETDSPFLSPEPHRGKKNMPYNVKEIYQKIADIKGVSVIKTEEIIDANVRALFDFS